MTKTAEARQMAKDYARWIAAAPAEERQCIRDWIAECGERGRRDTWNVFTREPRMSAKSIAAIFVENAHAAFRGAPSFTCGVCKVASPIAQNSDGILLCNDCLSPGDKLVALAEAPF